MKRYRLWTYRCGGSDILSRASTLDFAIRMMPVFVDLYGSCQLLNVNNVGNAAEYTKNHRPGWDRRRPVAAWHLESKRTDP